MKTFALLCALFATSALAQNPDVAKFAPRTILLVSHEVGDEGIVPMLITVDGQQKLEFIPTSKTKETAEKGGQLIRLGDLLSLLGSNAETISKLQAESAKLQAENDKLWKVAMKSEGVVVVHTEPQGPTQAQIEYQEQAEAYARRQQALQMWMVLQNRQQPYQIPVPVMPTSNRIQTNCTTYRVGDMTHTSCN